MLYEFLISVIETDTKNKVTSLGTTLLNYVVVETDPDDPTQNLYWLGFNNVKIQSGADPKTNQPVFIQIIARVGYNQDDANSVLGVLANISPYCSERAYNPPLTRAAIDADLVTYAGFDGAVATWTLHPGDNATVASAAALLAKFVPITG